MQIYHKIYLKIVPNREKHIPPCIYLRFSTAGRYLTFVYRAVRLYYGTTMDNYETIDFGTWRRHPPTTPQDQQHKHWTLRERSTSTRVPDNSTASIANFWWTMNVHDHPDALPDHTVELTTQAEHYGDHSNGVLELWNCDLRRCTPSCKYILYRASDVHGTYYDHIVHYYLDYSSWITRALLTCTACTISVS